MNKLDILFLFPWCNWTSRSKHDTVWNWMRDEEKRRKKMKGKKQRRWTNFQASFIQPIRCRTFHNLSMKRFFVIFYMRAKQRKTAQRASNRTVNLTQRSYARFFANCGVSRKLETDQRQQPRAITHDFHTCEIIGWVSVIPRTSQILFFSSS